MEVFPVVTFVFSELNLDSGVNIEKNCGTGFAQLENAIRCSQENGKWLGSVIRPTDLQE